MKARKERDESYMVNESLLVESDEPERSKEANVEQVFSRAGNLADPNMDPEFLAHLVMCAVNKKAFLPKVKDIKDKYYELFRGKGDDGDKGDGEAGPSNA